MSGHKINPSSPTPLHGIEREGHIDEAAARRISVARLSINPDVEQKLEEVMTRVRRKNYDKDDKTRWGSLRKQFREHGSTGFSPKLTEENSFELEHANNDKYQYHPGWKPRQTSPNHDADSGYNEERASPRYHTPDAQPVPKPATPVKKSEPPVVKATLEQLRRGSLFRGEKPITEKPHNAWQGLLARHQQERAGRPGKHVTIKTGKDDGRLIRSPPTSRPASSERRITPVEEVEPTVGSPTGLISAMKPTDGRRRPTPNKDNRPPSSKDQPVLHQPARDPGPLPSTSAAFLGSPPEYGKENGPTSAKQLVQPQPNKPPGPIVSTTDSKKNDAPGKGQENMPPKAKSPVPPSAHSSVPPSAKSPVPPKIKSPVPPHAPQPTKAPQPIPSTSGTQNIHAPKSGQDRLPSASKPPQIRTTSPTTKAPTNVAPPKRKEESVPASVKTVDETKKDGSFHDIQRDLAPPKKEPSASIAKQSQAGGSQRLTPETPANSAQKNVTNPTPEVTQAQQKDASAKAAPTGPVKAKSPKPKLQPPLQENGSVSKKKPSFSEKKYQTTDEPVKTAVIAKEVKPLERKLERKDTAQVLKDKDLNMDTEFLDDRNGSGKTLIKDRPAKKKGDWMASKKTQGTSKRHGKKKAVSRKDAHIQELSGTEKACYTCAGYCMCCACCYRLFKDDDDDEVFRRRKCITVFLAIALAIVLVGLIVGLCIGLGGLGGPAPTSPPRFILVPQNLNPIINVNGNQPVSAGTPAGGTGTAAGTANDSATATDGATPGGTTG
ncbi:proteoglycan 4-like [Branchiostoma floridae]|uniref:Proteoglycan 4-like n=1 Tax=Branchiostoma floridae TaxID=7739 RepID=A0A9J7HQA5_BRAFL|nr:proteoglycan 4-like [Branchiostoma floridae]